MAILIILIASPFGCAVSGVGAESRAHSEEAAMKKLLNKDDSFETVYSTAVQRGYKCNDEMDPRTNGRSVTCQKQMDLKVFGCKWWVDIYKAKSDRGEVFNISSYEACH
jgi:hypothetical protein